MTVPIELANTTDLIVCGVPALAVPTELMGSPWCYVEARITRMHQERTGCGSFIVKIAASGIILVHPACPRFIAKS
jgi:hypothetical protein